MNTTNILAEIIVVGSFSFLWTIPVFINFLDNNCIQSLLKLNLKSAVLFLAVIYFFGTLSNFLADKIFFLIDKIVAKKFGGKSEIRKKRTKIILNNSDATAYLFQRRSFVRIFRANSFNCFLASIVFHFNVGGLTSLLLFDKNCLSLAILIIALLSVYDSKKAYKS